MKSQSQTSHRSRPFSGETGPTRSTPRFPVTDYHFLGTTAEFRGRGLKVATPVRTPSFYRLSHDFIGSEMKRHYFWEAAFFAVIVGVSAWPIFSMGQAIADFVK